MNKATYYEHEIQIIDTDRDNLIDFKLILCLERN